MRTIAVVNQKGGCGKTITSINLSAFLAREQRRVLLVDMDPQGHATLGLLAEAGPPARTMYDLFLQRAAGQPAALRDVIRTVRDNLDVAPAAISIPSSGTASSLQRPRATGCPSPPTARGARDLRTTRRSRQKSYNRKRPSPGMSSHRPPH